MCVCVYVCLRIGYRELTHETIGISLLAVLMKQCLSLTYGKPHQSQMTVHLYLGGGGFAVCVCFTLLRSALCSMGCICEHCCSWLSEFRMFDFLHINLCQRSGPWTKTLHMVVGSLPLKSRARVYVNPASLQSPVDV